MKVFDLLERYRSNTFVRITIRTSKFNK